MINTFKNKIDGVISDEQELIFSLTGSNDIRIENKVFPVVDEMIYSNISIAPKEPPKWYSDETDFIFNMYIFFYRSEAQSDKANAGIFLFSASDGIAFNLLSGRPVVVSLKTT